MRWLLLGVVVLLASCASATKVGPGKVAVNEKMVAQLDKAWNRIDVPGKGKVEIWTADGLPLDRLMFYPAIGDGEALAELQDRKEKQQPRFHVGMPPHEIVELFEVLVAADGSTFKLERLSPVPFAGGEGFRFDYSVLRKQDEVELKGIAYGVVHHGKLFLMTFSAPKTYYFGKHLSSVESIAGSVQIRN